MLFLDEKQLVIVDEPVMEPHHCALAPQIHQDPEGFIDTGVNLPGFEPRVYVSMTSFKEIARRLGYEPVEGAREREAGLNERIEQLLERVEQANKALAAVEVLRASGYTAGKKPGPKPKEVAV